MGQVKDMNDGKINDFKRAQRHLDKFMKDDDVVSVNTENQPGYWDNPANGGAQVCSKDIGDQSLFDKEREKC